MATDWLKKAALTSTVLALLAAAAGGGCGGSSGESSATVARGPAYTEKKAQFLSSASTICSEERLGTEWRAADYRKEHPERGVPAGVVDWNVRRAVRLETAEAQADGVRQLPRPPGDRERIKALLRKLDAAIRATRRREVSTTAQLVDGLSTVDAALRSYGLGACAQGEWRRWTIQ